MVQPAANIDCVWRKLVGYMKQRQQHPSQLNLGLPFVVAIAAATQCHHQEIWVKKLQSIGEQIDHERVGSAVQHFASCGRVRFDIDQKRLREEGRERCCAKIAFDGLLNLQLQRVVDLHCVLVAAVVAAELWW